MEEAIDALDIEDEETSSSSDYEDYEEEGYECAQAATEESDDDPEQEAIDVPDEEATNEMFRQVAQDCTIPRTGNRTPPLNDHTELRPFVRPVQKIVVYETKSVGFNGIYWSNSIFLVNTCFICYVEVLPGRV